MTAPIDATGRAAAERLARFDVDLDLDDTNDCGWLDVTPIMVAHVVKTAQAAVQESRALGTGPGSAEPIAAAARFLASPKRERFVLQSTFEAITTLQGVPKPESDQVRPG